MQQNVIVNYMLQRVSGVVLEITPEGVLIDVHGFGIFVFVADTSTLRLDTTATLHTHMAVKQDGIDIYGFANTDDLGFFKKCLTVSGVGPKSALSYLRRAPRIDLQNAIAHKDLDYLVRVAGLGKKAGEKLIVELSEKMPIEGSHQSEDADLLDTLIALGYTEKEARAALSKIPKEVIGKDARLRYALSK